MIHYHSSAIWPVTACVKALRSRHACVAFSHRANMKWVVEICQSFCLDNGAFTAWRRKKPITDWSPYYEWVRGLCQAPGFDFAFIPDVIGGSEKDNNRLVFSCTLEPVQAVPVWHLNESLVRLQRLCNDYPRVAFGSSGEFAQLRTKKWWGRMHEAFSAICDGDGRPLAKVHGLRMMMPDIVKRFPFASVDSSSVGMNCYRGWHGTYVPATPETRACVLAERLEQHNSPQIYRRRIGTS